MVNMKAMDGAMPSPLCFGCMQFGGTADEVTSEAMFEACRAENVNFFDTAHVYTDGQSERLLGQFVKKSHRESLIIATKVAYVGGSGRQTLLSQFEQSRLRLDMDMLDILYLHRWDPDTCLKETFDTLAQLQSSGKIRYIGVSNFAAWQVMKAQSVAATFGTQIDILQPMYSLVKRQAEVELLPMAVSEGIAVAPYSPLGGGLLTGKYENGGSGRLSTDTRYAARYGPEWMQITAAGLLDLAEKFSINPATLAVAWAGQHPAVTAPIISARNVVQLQPSLAAQNLSLTVAQYAQIEALSPRPAPATDRLEEAMK